MAHFKHTVIDTSTGKRADRHVGIGNGRGQKWMQANPTQALDDSFRSTSTSQMNRLGN